MGPAAAWGARVERLRRHWFCICFMLAITASAMFQCLLAGYFGSDAAATPDTPTYVELAEQLQEFLQGETKTVGDFARTPGYPLVILALAAGAHIDLVEVGLPIRDWSGTNDQGRRLVRRIILFQQTLGFLIPILLFVIAHQLTKSPFWALLGSFVYYTDISSVCYQFTVLTETTSVATILAVYAALLAMLNRPTVRRALLLGALVGWAILLRPSNLLLAPLAAVFVARSGVPAGSSRRGALAVFLLAAILPAAVWTAGNFQKYGHAFYTKNQTITLQNYTGPRFAELPLAPGELRVLQDNVKTALAVSPHFAMSRCIWATSDQLQLADDYDMYRLMDAANRVTIAANPREFLSRSWSRFLAMWAEGFLDAGNSYAQQRFEALFAVGPDVFRDSRLLLGSRSLWWFLPLCTAAFFATRRAGVRAGILFGVLFALSYMFLTAVFDENEYLRHGMAARALVNVMMVAGVGIVLQRATGVVGAYLHTTSSVTDDPAST